MMLVIATIEVNNFLTIHGKTRLQVSILTIESGKKKGLGVLVSSLEDVVRAKLSPVTSGVAPICYTSLSVSSHL